LPLSPWTRAPRLPLALKQALVLGCADGRLEWSIRPPPVTLADSSGATDASAPLSGAEVRALLVARWQASHDLRLVQIRGRLYLQVMWNHLEQQSFPLSAEDYADHIERVAAALNDLGLATTVRQWLVSTRDRPRLGKALSLPLEPVSGRASEFLL